MSYALLWIEMLAIALLWMALTAACLARVKRRRLRGMLTSGARMLPLVPFVMMVAMAMTYRLAGNADNGWLAYSSAFLVCDCLGMAIIGSLARPRAAGMVPGALTWPRMALAVAWAMSMTLATMTIWNMDMAVRARASVLVVEADAVWLGTGPLVASEDQNAAPLYQRALARLRNDPPIDVKSAPIGVSSTFDAKEPAMIAFLARQAPTLALLRRAAAMPGCRFDEDITPPVLDQLLSGLGEERGAANDLLLEARYELAEGRVSSAVADVEAILRMSRHFAQRPTLVAGYVAFGIDALGARGLEDVLPAVTRPQEIAGLNSPASSSMRRASWRMLQGEERWGLGIFSRVGPVEPSSADIGRPSNPTEQTFGNPLFRILFLSDELDAYIQLMDSCKQVTREPYFKGKEQLARLEAEYGPTPPFRGMFTKLLAPSMIRFLESTGRAEATDTCADVAVAMTRYRLDYGHLPDHLADLVPAYMDAIPVDPFDGQPLRLIVKDNQWIIYCIGTGKDDGDVTTPAVKNTKVIFVLKASAPATRP